MLVFCQNDRTCIVDSGVSKELADLWKSIVSRVEYDLQFTVPTEVEEPLKGSATIRFHLSNAQQPLIIDFNNPAEKVIEIKKSGAHISYSFKNCHVTITNSELIEEINEFKFEFFAGDQALNRNKEYLYTLFVPNSTRTFSCSGDLTSRRDIFS